MRQIMKWGVLAVVAVGVMTVVAGSWQKRSRTASRTACIRNLKTIGVALHAYHDSNAHFPAAYSASQPPHSWRVALLPWMNEQSLFEKYDLEPHGTMGQIQRCWPCDPARMPAPN